MGGLSPMVSFTEELATSRFIPVRESLGKWGEKIRKKGSNPRITAVDHYDLRRSIDGPKQFLSQEQNVYGS